MWGLRGKGCGGALAAAAVAVAGLAVLVPAEAGPVPAVYADRDEAVAEPGMIVVADRVNDRLQAFYPDGEFAFKFGAGFGRVHSIDIGPDGMIVTAGGNGWIEAFYPNGTHAFRVVEGGEGVGRVNGVGMKAAVAPDGRIVVMEYGRIQVFEPDGKLASVFDVPRDMPSPGGWQFLDIAVAPDGRIVMVDSEEVAGYCGRSYAMIINPNGTLAHSLALDGGVRHCKYAHDVAVAPNGRIVVGFQGEPVGVYRPLPNGTFAYLPLNGTTYQPGPNGTLVAVPGIEAAFVGGMSGIAVGPDGEIVVGGGDNHVRVFRPNGTRALTFGGYGSVQGGFDRPTDAAVGPDGRIVVAEPGNHAISVFHPNGTLDFAFGEYSHGDGGFYEPHQVAVGPDGRIVVGDTRKHRILVFEPNGSPAFAFGSAGYGVGEIDGIRDVAVAPNGSVVVVDEGGYQRGRVQVFGPNGSFVSELIDEGSSYWRWQPTSAAVGPDGRIVVVNRQGEQALVFNPNGTEAFRVDLGSAVRGNVAVGPDGRIVVVQGSRSQVFNPDGTFAFATEIDVHAVSVAVGPNREIVVVDDDADRVQVFNPNGTFAFALLPDVSQGKFNGVGAIAVGPLMPRPIGDPEPLWVVVGEPDVGGGPILRNFTDVGDAANVTIDVAALAGPGGADALNGSESSTVTFPASETTVAASFAEVTFPPNVTASHVPAGGRLALRIAADVPAAEQVQAALGRNGSGPELVVLLQRVVEVGAEESRIMFDLPVRISLEGQAGGRAFYIEGLNGTIIPIDEACVADNVDAVHRQLGGAGECQIDSADGPKIVHTYHLTKFGTVSAEGPVPGLVIDPEPGPPFFGGGSNSTNGTASPPPHVNVPFGGGSNGTNGTVAPPPIVVVPPEPQWSGEPTCSIGISHGVLDMSARPGEYSEPVHQYVQNGGTLPFAQVEINATPWHDGSGPPSSPPLPGVPPAYSGPTEGRTAGVFTMYMIASLPAGVTEVLEGPRFVDRALVAGGDEYVPLVDGKAVVFRDLDAQSEVELWFRLNLTPYDGLLAGTLTQSITYQAECVPP